MKLLINSSTLSGTGVTQVTVSFLLECMKHQDHEYHVFLSKTVSDQLDKLTFPSNFIFYKIEHHPLYGIKGYRIRKRLKNLANEIKPDCVFSVFGPSWIKFNFPSVFGYAYPHYVYPESPLFKILGITERFKISLMKCVHRYYLKRDGDYFITESQDVSDRLSRYLGVDSVRIFTVTNTCNNYFNAFEGASNLLLPSKEKNEFRFLSLCSFQKHKNLEILNKVIPKLKKNYPDLNIKFILTIDEEMYNLKFDEEVKGSLVNLGRVQVKDCPQLYKECDAMFLPTLLECFSASYPEAMRMKVPIVTSDLSFAKCICGDSANYFNPLDENSIVNSILKIVSDPIYRDSLISKGTDRLEHFDSAAERTRKYLEICEKTYCNN